MSQSFPKVEKEIVLMVNSEVPEDTVGRILTLESLKTYSLTTSDSLDLHDVYFETSDKSLARKKLNLRLRQKNSAWLVTMKRSPRSWQWSRNERAELELPWSKESLDRVATELSANKILLSRPHNFNPSPLDAFKSMGLVVVQDRETQRRTKVMTSNKTRRSVAELACDHVTYHFHNSDASLYEIEVEAKDTEGGKGLSRMKAGLLDIFGPDLVAWKWGKLMTGRAIERLLNEGKMLGLVQNGIITPAGIERVKRALQM